MFKTIRNGNIEAGIKWNGNQIESEIDKKLKSIEKEVAEKSVSDAKNNLRNSVTYRTGAAERSIVAKKSKSGKGWYVRAGSDKKTKEGIEDPYYFKFIELGAYKGKLPAHHPMYKAMKANKKGFRSKIISEVNSVIK